jgi:hypothetical protein
MKAACLKRLQQVNRRFRENPRPKKFRKNHMSYKERLDSNRLAEGKPAPRKSPVKKQLASSAV